nr:hypothetical protein [Tanacetum cinerariifolium]
VPNEENNITEEKVTLEWGYEQDSEHSDDNNEYVKKDDKDGDADDEGDDHISDTQDADDEDDKEMINAKVDDSDKGVEEITDAGKAYAEKISEAKDDAKKTELPPSSSSLSVFSGFGDQFLKLSSDSFLVSTVKDTTNTKINSLLEVKIQTEVPHIHPCLVYLVAKLEKDMSELKSVDQYTESLAILKSQVPSIVDNYLGSKFGDVFQKELKKHTADFIQKYSLQQFSKTSKKQTPIVDLEQGSEKSALEILQVKREQVEKQQKPKFTIKSTDNAALEEYDLKSTLYQSMYANKSFNRYPANHQLYHKLMKAFIEDKNAMDKGVTDTIQDHKRKHDDDEDDDDEDPPAGPNQEYINSPSWNRPTFYKNDEEHSIQYKEYLENSSNAIAPDLPTKEPEYSLNMGDEHPSTISETKSDELIKSSIENLVPILSEFEDVPMENFKINSNPLFDDEEIISNKIDLHYFNAESNLIESLPNRDTLFDSSPKFDYLEEFSGELMPTSIINEQRIRREHEEYIRLIEKLLTINSFSRSLENFHANTIIETLPTSPIPVEDSDSLREEIDIFTGTDDLMPSSIESDDYDSEGDIHFLEELLSNDSIPLSENESSKFYHRNDPSFPRPPLEPPDVE